MSRLGSPFEALVGGVSLGLLSAGRLLIHGEVFGISGIIRGTLCEVFRSRHYPRSKAAIFAGLLLGGLALRVLAPGRLGTLPPTFHAGRAALAGLLVGLGASLANGCTSGHGICGNAQFRPRSIFFTAVIIGVGSLTARLSGTLDALDVASGAFPSLAAPGSGALSESLALLGATAAYLTLSAACLARTGRALGPCGAGDQGCTGALKLGADFAEGVLFTLSLGVAGMTDPRNVAAFLALDPKGFDYSLAFVMGGAVFTAAPIILAFQSRPRPAPLSEIDKRLAVGAILFGIGWGLAGLCPGPALAGLMTLKKPLLAFNTAACAGFYLAPDRY